MSFDLNKAIGVTLSDLPASWNQRDLLLYSVGIGAKKTDFPFIYELSEHPHSCYSNASTQQNCLFSDDKFSAFPTYPVVLNLKGLNVSYLQHV